MKSIKSITVWSVISAAFIGPGTVTTAVSAGSQFQLQLLWAVVFATIACVVLQEVSARITIGSGLSLGQAVVIKFGRQKGFWIQLFVGGAVLLGCAAYEAGNILGAVSGVSILFDGDGRIYTVIITACSALILWSGKGKWISLLMTLLVVLMGIAFFFLALQSDFSFMELLTSSVIPTLPGNAELLTLGLVGTTIVPYNLFLGSGISKGQTLPEMRMGLIISVLIGGLITALILIAGTVVSSFASFAELAGEFQLKVGMAGVWFLGLGLFAAGFSSAITSPYAASIIATTVFDVQDIKKVRIVWGVVLLTGFAFGISGVKPIPVILVVQALNGLILPLITAYLILIVNDRELMPLSHRHARVYDLVLLLIFGAVLLIGLNNIDKSISSGLALENKNHFESVLGLTGVTLISFSFFLWKRKS